MFSVFFAMSEPQINARNETGACSLNYPNPDPAATSSCDPLREIITTRILKDGPLSFTEFQEIALYHPDHGYYAKNTTQVGQSGDFFTSVSVGPLFGQLLARRFLDWWEKQGKPSPWRICEIGAHDGKLAADILATIAELSPTAWEGLEYATFEPLSGLRDAQSKLLSPLASKLRIGGNIDNLTPLPGIVFGNEILDALPFHLVCRGENDWQELYVTSHFDWLPVAIDPHSPLSKKLQSLEGDYPEGYQTEVRTNYISFLKCISNVINDGLFLFIDYGFAAPEYYDVLRMTGTLRTFSGHRAGEHPLEEPGKKDITAHVDFTDLSRDAMSLGWYPVDFRPQGSYLTHVATAMIQTGGIDTPKAIAEFKTLTHPAHLGASFHVIEFSKSKRPNPEVLHRLALDEPITWLPLPRWMGASGD
jgi:SAM-dependent MidA family methyltransferase